MLEILKKLTESERNANFVWHSIEQLNPSKYQAEAALYFYEDYHNSIHEAGGGGTARQQIRNYLESSYSIPAGFTKG
jgi:hypothetical protein